MTITLDLPKSVEETIEEQAKQRDMAVADYLLDVVLRTANAERSIWEKNRRAIEVLESWKNATPEEVEEQKRAWEFLRKALDEDRPSHRELFPEGSVL